MLVLIALPSRCKVQRAPVSRRGLGPPVDGTTDESVRQSPGRRSVPPIDRQLQPARYDGPALTTLAVDDLAPLAGLHSGAEAELAATLDVADSSRVVHGLDSVLCDRPLNGRRGASTDARVTIASAGWSGRKPGRPTAVPPDAAAKPDTIADRPANANALRPLGACRIRPSVDGIDKIFHFRPRRGGDRFGDQASAAGRFLRFFFGPASVRAVH